MHINISVLFILLLFSSLFSTFAYATIHMLTNWKLKYEQSKSCIPAMMGCMNTFAHKFPSLFQVHLQHPFAQF